MNYYKPPSPELREAYERLVAHQAHLRRVRIACLVALAPIWVQFATEQLAAMRSGAK